MSYKINTTDGTLLVDLIDGRIDNSTTDLTLVGRNFTGYGEAFNENFVKLLENFKNTFPPANPLMGQLWFDSSEGRLKVYDGSTFKSTDTTIVSSTLPNLVSGDVWIDSGNKQVWFSDGSSIILAGPPYTQQQGKTIIEPVTIVDNFGIDRTVGRLVIGNDPVALIAKTGFIAGITTENTEILQGFNTTIKAGFNISSNFSNFNFNSNASSANALIDISGNLFTPNDFLTANGNNINNGTLHVKNDNGLTIGIDSDFVLRVESNATFFRNRLNNADMRFQVRNGFFDVDVISVKAATNRIGIWRQNPLYDLDVDGTVRISGDLIVEGNTTSLDVTNLTVEDKTVQLASAASGVYLDDAALDGAGIVIKGSVSDKSIVWSNSNNSFNINTNLNLESSNVYRIGGNDILSSTTLSSSVTSALGLTEIGTLVNLDVDNVNVNGNTITSNNSSLIIKSTGNLIILDQSGTPNAIKIEGVAKPVDADTDDVVATKGYVDERYQFTNERLALDSTGLTDIDIALLLEDLYPSSEKNVGIYAFVHTISYTGAVTYNAGDGLNKTFVAVDRNGIENQSVLQDISFGNITENITITPTRAFKRFRVVSPSPGVKQWQYDIDLPSSV